MRPFLLVCLFTLAACQTADPKPKTIVYQISGREGGRAAERQFIYRIKTPYTWTFLPISSNESLANTTVPLCEWKINNIKIAIHNFPYNDTIQRISPQAQINRWKSQIISLDPFSVKIQPQAFSGFAGFFFEASGSKDDQPITVLAWSMQLAPEHDSTLAYQAAISRTPEELAHFQQMRADYTIKVTGPPNEVAKFRKEIIETVQTFEFIDAINNNG